MLERWRQALPLVRRSCVGLIGAAVVTGLAAAGPNAAAEATENAGVAVNDPWRICAHFAAQTETQQDLPQHLLSAISKVESGRWDPARKAVSAWPWTVTSGGDWWFLPTKAAAITQVEALRAEGRRNIDVGCMQVNLMHHPEAFADLEEAFDPARNIGYAAGLLLSLRQEGRSWTKAIAFYHSRTAKFNGPYRLKVFRAWREERHRANRAAETTAVAQQTALNP